MGWGWGWGKNVSFWFVDVGWVKYSRGPLLFEWLPVLSSANQKLPFLILALFGIRRYGWKSSLTDLPFCWREFPFSMTNTKKSQNCVSV